MLNNIITNFEEEELIAKTLRDEKLRRVMIRWLQVSNPKLAKKKLKDMNGYADNDSDEEDGDGVMSELLDMILQLKRITILQKVFKSLKKMRLIKKQQTNDGNNNNSNNRSIETGFIFGYPKKSKGNICAKRKTTAKITAKSSSSRTELKQSSSKPTMKFLS